MTNQPSTPPSQNRSTPVSVVSSPVTSNPPLGTQPSPPQPVGIRPDSSPVDLVRWGLKRFAHESIVLTTSFGMEGCALIDICSRAIGSLELSKMTIASIDTGFFFPETKQLREKLIRRYDNLNFVTWQSNVSIQEQRETYGDALWKNNPNLCCHIRKVEPMRDNVSEFGLWITALRRSQTKQRATTEIVSWDWQYQLLKFCPIASWSRADVWQYIQENEVPFNQLHLQNYPSVSCFHCTQPVPGSSPDSDAREGRWEGSEKTECGLHFSI